MESNGSRISNTARLNAKTFPLHHIKHLNRNNLYIGMGTREWFYCKHIIINMYILDTNMKYVQTYLTHLSLSVLKYCPSPKGLSPDLYPCVCGWAFITETLQLQVYSPGMISYKDLSL